VFNPHKWLLTNFDCTAYFVRDPAAKANDQRRPAGLFQPVDDWRAMLMQVNVAVEPLERRRRRFGDLEGSCPCDGQ
jgi:hypothetical protein